MDRSDSDVQDGSRSPFPNGLGKRCFSSEKRELPCKKEGFHSVLFLLEDRPPDRCEMNMAEPITRNSLLVRLQDANDVAAWDDFAELYGPVVYRVALGKGFQSADAEDLVQEVFLAVSLSLNQWLAREDRGAFRAWLIRIARNEAIDRMRERATRSLGRGGSAAEQMLAQVPARSEVSDSLDLEYERAVFRWAAKRAEEEVSDQVWQAFWLTSIEGVPIPEAASRLQTGVGNIYVSRSRVMARIKHHIQKRKERS